MYCKNCGNKMDAYAAICVKCGCAKGVGHAYCPVCGGSTTANAAVCLSCGTALSSVSAAEKKSKVAAGLLAIFVGSLGVHNFYLGYTKKAVAQLLICLLGSLIVIGPIISGVWALIEGILIFTGSINVDGKGIPLKSE